MSMSMRDQLLKAGLINKKQANEAERQQQRQERQPLPKQGRTSGAERAPAPQQSQGAKLARDQALNRQRNEKSEKKARLAQIKQLVEQNRLPTVEGGEPYNFVDGGKIRRIAVNASIRDRLGRGEIVIVRADGGYDLIPASVATRIRERDETAVIAPVAGKENVQTNDPYQGFAVPDDLIW